MNTLIFCVSYNCAPITAVMLRSFHRYHDRKIHVIGTQPDFATLGDIADHPNNVLVDVSGNPVLMDRFRRGHAGTTTVFAMVIQQMIAGYDYFIQIDGDVFFKKESVSVIEDAFANGYDIVGTRRCYKNNPSGVKGLDDLPDSISTYFFGMKFSRIPDYPFDDLCRYCEGTAHPLGWLVLDSFDGVVHGAMNNGGEVKFLDWKQFGGQNEHGIKPDYYKTNLHMDCGENLIHMGGVGSGYAFFYDYSSPVESYAQWALGRWTLFAKLFYGQDIPYNEPAVYGADGRWIFGSYDDNIIEQLKHDLEN